MPEACRQCCMQKQLNLALCHWVMYKDVIAIPCVLDGSHYFKVFVHDVLYLRLSSVLSHLYHLGYQ